MDRGVVESEWERRDRLQRSLGALGMPTGAPAVPTAGRGVRRLLARHAIEESIRHDAEVEARRGREALEGVIAVIGDHVARRDPPVPTPVAAPGPTRAAPQAPPPAWLAGLVARWVVSLPEFWTPKAVLGFRVWEVRGRLQGAWRAWDAPEREARCLSRQGSSDEGDVPHTDGSCGRPPCGIYCFKEPKQLLDAFGLPAGNDRWVMGLASLSGKVVEHDRGYRAQRARVVAAAVVGRGRMIRIEGDALLRALFARPEPTIEGLLSADSGVVEEVGNRRLMAAAVASYLGLVRDFHQASL